MTEKTCMVDETKQDYVNVWILDKNGDKKFEYFVKYSDIYQCEESNLINGYYMVKVDTEEHFFAIEPYDHIIFSSKNNWDVNKCFYNHYSHCGIVCVKDYLDNENLVIKVRSIFAV